MRRAFTLIEAVVALAVVAAGLVWLMSSSHYAVEGTALAAQRTEIATAASEMVSKIQRKGEWPSETRGVFRRAGGARWRLERTPWPLDRRLDSCCRATLIVSYEGVSGKERRMEYQFVAPR